MAHLRKLAFAAVRWTTVSTVTRAVLSLAQLAYLGRVLAPSDFGLMAMVLVVIGLGQAFSDMGISNAIIHFQDEDRDKLSSLYWINIAAGLAIFLLINGASPLVAAFYHQPRLENLLFLTSFVFVIIPIGQQSQALMERGLRFGEIAVAEILASVISVGVTVYAAHDGLGVYSLVWGQLANATVRTLIITSVGFRQWRPHIHFAKHDLRGYLGFGLYQMGERSINYLGSNLDKLLIGYLLGPELLGFYDVAYQLMSRPYRTLNPIITRVAFPLFAKVQHDNQRMRRGYLDAIRVIAFVLFPIYFAMIFLAKPVLLLIVGRQWLPAVPVFQILCVLGCLYTLGNPLGSLLLAKGRADVGFFLNAFRIMLYAAAMSISARFGITAIALSLVFATGLVMFPIGFWLRWKVVDMRPGEYLKAFLPMLLASLAMGIAIYYLHINVFITVHVWSLASLIAIGALLYLAMMYGSQRQTLLRIFQRASPGNPAEKYLSSGS